MASRAGYYMKQFGTLSEQLNSSPTERHRVVPQHEGNETGYNLQVNEEDTETEESTNDDRETRE